MISIIIRSKNEERWIGSCLEAVSRQTCTDHEVILVDNNSTDKTVEKALQYDVTLVRIDKFKPGAAINRGIEASKGDILVCLSGHCIPVDEHWLANLVAVLEDETVAGVYGRQEPLSFTPDLDKRDLLITFGLDPRTQVKDSFFHNANSAFRRSTWDKFPFDEDVTNIEDRLWANQVQKAGMKIMYEPSSSVYHHHGIHHGGDSKRCGNIIRILDSFGQEEIRTLENNIDARHMSIVLVIPVREEGLREVGGKPLYQYTIEHARQSELVSNVIVSTESEVVATHARESGINQVQMRSEEESRFDVLLEQMMCNSLEKIEQDGIIPDVFVMLEATFPFRDHALIDKLIAHFVEGGFDTVIPARKEYNSCWMEEDGSYRRIDQGHIARQFKQPFFTGLKGLCCVCSPATIREGQFFGDKVGLVELTDTIPAIEIQSDTDVVLAETILSSSRFRSESGQNQSDQSQSGQSQIEPDQANLSQTG